MVELYIRVRFYLIDDREYNTQQVDVTASVTAEYRSQLRGRKLPACQVYVCDGWFGFYA